MLVKYKGEYVREKRTYGCSKCGTAHSVNGEEIYKTSYRTYYNGRLYIFEQDKEVEVDNILGAFLLSRSFTDKEGNVVKSFEEVTSTEN